MELIFLGTTCMVPTKERNHYSVYLERVGEGILFDCGEGTQRQMKIAGVKPSKIKKIFISHWHGDHVLGIPGLLQTMAASDFNSTLKIFGPFGTKAKIKSMFDAFVFDNNIDLEVVDIEEGKIFENSEYYVESYRLEHSIESFGYKFIEKDTFNINTLKVKKIGIPDGPLLAKLKNGNNIEFEGKKYNFEDLTTIKKGKVLGIISDTCVTNNCYNIAQDCDVLISEASYSHKQENKAREYFHLTTKQAAQIASMSGSQKLILTHFSQRYSDVSELESEAREVFDNTVCAYDFMKLKF